MDLLLTRKFLQFLTKLLLTSKIFVMYFGGFISNLYYEVSLYLDSWNNIPSKKIGIEFFRMKLFMLKTKKKN